MSDVTELAPRARAGRKPNLDEAPLLYMARLVAQQLERDGGENDRAAARQTVEDLGMAAAEPHVAPQHIADRLRGKFRRRRTALLLALGPKQMRRSAACAIRSHG